MTCLKQVLTALFYFAETAIPNSAELAPDSAYSIRPSSFQGIVSHSIDHGGYRVVVTLASNAEGSPIRLVSILGPGQHAVILVPQPVGQPSIDFDVTKNGGALLVKGSMTELVINACLATGECKENRLTYDARDISPLTCMIAGQSEVARWQQQHPKWQIRRWRCDIVRDLAEREL